LLWREPLKLRFVNILFGFLNLLQMM